ncbi:helix-turn-helix transcriptional regulator [Marinobacter sp. VGCF2001]|uniref:helix-turn-helix transcriptional regulator n=1 Tax=Marinobacter sp. VGCF2001 TaxID=3417189 RepID=UPI003CF56791
MNPVLQQIKDRRLKLGLKQNDMMLRVGMSRQQYQRLESRGNPRLDTLELVAQGLGAQLLLIPNEKLAAVRALLEGTASAQPTLHASDDDNERLYEDPWKGLLGDDE